MPCLRIETSVDANDASRQLFMEAATEVVASALGKSTDYVQVIFEGEKPMLFGGSLEPTAFLSLISLGMTDHHAESLSEQLCDLIGESLQVPPDRIFIAFHDHPRERFGWNGKTFAS